MLSSCVRLSVRLLQAGIVPKWLNVESQKQRTGTGTLQFFDAKDLN